ncbi:MAG TPA: sigma-70 family RNA polymerase sigma factor, partial [Rhizobiaceae bacterium]|nr:sigma-70 family RNA polymerase sigma factor [Rhizobiaceae bacterium]
GRLTPASPRLFGDLGLAEDCLQDAAEAALRHWARNGVPASPAGWLLQVARRKAIDRIRREKIALRHEQELERLLELDQNATAAEPEEIPDERLRLIFTCCHPALDRRSATALTLRMLGGLTTAEIARAFLDAPETLAQRLVRAKAKIRAAHIPFETPGPEAWPERLAAVLDVVYLVYNEGHAAMHGAAYTRPDLCNEAIRLARLLNSLKPGQAEIEGLLALLLLTESRHKARLRPDGALVPLEAQDRSLWDRILIAEGEALVVQALKRGRPGAFVLQAAVAAVHAMAASFEATDWMQIVLLYDELERASANPVFALNQAVALSYADTVDAALLRLATIGDRLDGYQPFHACLADLHRRDGNQREAASAYRRAIAMTDNEAERRFLAERLAALCEDSG